MKTPHIHDEKIFCIILFFKNKLHLEGKFQGCKNHFPLGHTFS